MADVKHMQKPCANCPFTRNVKPGTLGGSPPETFIGQARGPFVLPCHKACDFDDPHWKDKAFETPQCAGAAIYRANTGIAPLLPQGIHTLPPDPETVFASPAEFLAHHKEINLMDAMLVLAFRTPEDLAREQLARIDNRKRKSTD